MKVLELKAPAALVKGNEYTVVLRGARDYRYGELYIEYTDPALMVPQRRKVEQTGNPQYQFRSLTAKLIGNNYAGKNNYVDLLAAMLEVYENFTDSEIVTVLRFKVGEDAR